MRKRRLAQLPFIAAMALLNGCGGLNSSGRSVAPPLVDYPSAFQARAAEELEGLLPACPLHAPGPSCSTLASLVEDYGELRARVRGQQYD